MTPVCPYCNNPSKKVTGKAIYPHRPDLFKLVIYQCEPCDAYVGCHGSSDKPLGLPANKETRKARSRAHRSFDQLWRNHIITSRTLAYKWLRTEMPLTSKECHIGNFTITQCEEVISHVDILLSNYSKDLTCLF